MKPQRKHGGMSMAEFRRLVAALPEPETRFLELVGSEAVDALHRVGELRDQAAPAPAVAEALGDYWLSSLVYSGTLRWLKRCHARQ